MAGDRTNAGIERDKARNEARALRGLQSSVAALDAEVTALDAAVAAIDAEVDGKEAAGTVAAHELAADPHAGYQKESEKGAANGYASLGAGGLVPVAQLASGTPDGTKFVRDDGTLATPGGGGGGGVELFMARRLVALRM